MAAHVDHSSRSFGSPPQAQTPVLAQGLPRSLRQRVCDAYFQAIKNLVRFLERNRWYITAAVLEVFFAEPFQVLKASVLYPFGWKSRFNFYGLNPEAITADVAKKRPVLLLHGDFHNQSAWIPLARKLQKANLGPIFTLNLSPVHSFSAESLRRVNHKITEIRALYGRQDVVIDLVGHSGGVLLASYLSVDQSGWSFVNGDFRFQSNSLQWAPEVGKVIGVGFSPCFDRASVYEITGERDVLNQEPPRCKNHFKADVGHLELLYSSVVQDQVIQWLKA